MTEQEKESRKLRRKLETMIRNAQTKLYRVHPKYVPDQQKWIAQLEALLGRANKGEMVTIPGEE